MATIIGTTTRRRRRKRLQGSPAPKPSEVAPAPSPASTPAAAPKPAKTETTSTESASGREFCRKMVSYPSTEAPNKETQRRKVPDWVNKEDTEMFHAFCVANDVLGTSYRPTECLYWDESA